MNTYVYYFNGKVMIDADSIEEADEIFDELAEDLEVDVTDVAEL